MKRLMFVSLFLCACSVTDDTSIDTQSSALEDEDMCKPLGAHCFDPEVNPHAAACCNPDTAGCFRGECTEKTVNPPGCIPQDAACSPGVDTCCSAGPFDPLGVCEDVTGEGTFVCVPPA